MRNVSGKHAGAVSVMGNDVFVNALLVHYGTDTFLELNTDLMNPFS